MGRIASRRGFLQASTCAGIFGSLAECDFLRGLAPVSAAEATPQPDMVRYSPEIEPLVRLIEDTPREQLLEAVAQRIKQGTKYQQLLSALLLAGVRSIEPRPVGFKFHAVLMVNSAHLASLASPDEHRWLPIFWALDQFKDDQADQKKQKAWTMPAATKSPLPPAGKARQALIDALDAWDAEAAEAAMVSLARSATQQEVYDVLFHYGARDFRNIGHKAIFVANSKRALECLGWQNAEAVLRSLALALVEQEGSQNPEQRNLPSILGWRANLPRIQEFPKNWSGGRIDSAATSDLLAAFRQASTEDIGGQVLEMLKQGIAPQSIWDAVFVGAGELLLRERGFIGIHAVTTANALHYAYEATGDEATRRLLLLQGAALLPFMRDDAIRRSHGKPLPGVDIEKMEPQPLAGSSEDATAEILAEISRDKPAAARKMLTFLGSHAPGEFVDAARLLIFFKGNEVHDYKFSSAIFEDYLHVSPAWRNRYLAVSPLWLRGSKDRDNSVAQRTRQALQG